MTYPSFSEDLNIQRFGCIRLPQLAIRHFSAIPIDRLALAAGDDKAGIELRRSLARGPRQAW